MVIGIRERKVYMAKQKMKTVDMSVKVEDLNTEESETLEQAVAAAEGTPVAPKSAKKVHARSGKYHAVKARVDRTKNYPLKQAVELVMTTSYSKFTGTVIADLAVKDDKITAEVAYPYSTGKTVRVAIVTDDLIKEVESGKIDFDILVTHPSFMPKLAKLARVLGPKGLMPNPKNGTITPDPDKKAKELAGGKTTIKTERKAPLIHAIVGKTNQEIKEVAANVDALVKAIGTTKITKLTLSATMSPGVKVDFNKLA
jgi:large subunit ribosomal protein L1